MISRSDGERCVPVDPICGLTEKGVDGKKENEVRI